MAGWELAAAVSNAGGLGVIGSEGVSVPDLLESFLKYSEATKRPMAV